MKALFNGTIKEFKNFTKSDLQLDNWKIYDMEIEDRYNRVKENSYVKQLHKKASNSGITYDKCETISWLDSQSIMLKVINRLGKLSCSEIVNNIKLIQEFQIPFTKKRSDYLLIFEDKILIVEFSYNKFENIEYQYFTKLNQVIGYKELVSNIVSKDVYISTYTFLLHPDNNDSDVNKEEIDNFVKYIKFIFEKKQVDAYKELSKMV